MKKLSVGIGLGVVVVSVSLVAALAPRGAGASMPPGSASAYEQRTPAPRSSTDARAAIAAAAASPAAPAASVTPSALPASTWGRPVLGEAPVPEARSDAPAASDWEKATYVEPSRRVGRACSVRLLREWARVRCDVPSAGARVMAGSAKDVDVHLVPSPRGGKDDPPIAIEVTFPLRRGEPRLIQLFGATSGYDGGQFPVNGNVVEASWPDSAPTPTLVIR